jgi:hypothetical protein
MQRRSNRVSPPVLARRLNLVPSLHAWSQPGKPPAHAYCWTEPLAPTPRHSSTGPMAQAHSTSLPASLAIRPTRACAVQEHTGARKHPHTVSALSVSTPFRQAGDARHVQSISLAPSIVMVPQVSRLASRGHTANEGPALPRWRPQ